MCSVAVAKKITFAVRLVPRPLTDSTLPWPCLGWVTSIPCWKKSGSDRAGVSEVPLSKLAAVTNGAAAGAGLGWLATGALGGPAGEVATCCGLLSGSSPHSWFWWYSSWSNSSNDANSSWCVTYWTASFGNSFRKGLVMVRFTPACRRR